MMILTWLLLICLLILISFCRSSYLSFGAYRKGMITNFALLHSRVHLDLKSSILRSDSACFVAFRMKLFHDGCTPCFPFSRENMEYTCALVKVKTCLFLFVGALMDWYVVACLPPKISLKVLKLYCW